MNSPETDNQQEKFNEAIRQLKQGFKNLNDSKMKKKFECISEQSENSYPNLSEDKKEGLIRTLNVLNRLLRQEEGTDKSQFKNEINAFKWPTWLRVGTITAVSLLAGSSVIAATSSPFLLVPMLNLLPIISGGIAAASLIVFLGFMLTSYIHDKLASSKDPLIRSMEELYSDLSDTGLSNTICNPPEPSYDAMAVMFTKNPAVTPPEPDRGNANSLPSSSDEALSEQAVTPEDPVNKISPKMS